ncbi:MAG: hypothetical protein KF864_11840 [Phycisphaeraceae bacterium]|nr:hypothetical protein [Phycisphaeraceae bacterium]MBX3410948.1 hypothetical protein [Phycisphaeraceae bacterium]
MHALTKVFVIIAAVLSIALSTLVIAYAVNTDKIVSDYHAQVQRAVTIEAQQVAQASVHGQERLRQQSVKEQLERDNASLREQIRSLEAERATLLTDKKTAEQERDSITAKISELGETVKTQANLITSYRDEVTQMRRSELTSRQRELEMDNLISDLQSQREVLEQNFRALQEQLAEAKRAATGIPSAGIVSGADQAFVYTGPRIQGRVEEVRQDPASGRTLVKINVGTNTRVQKNMKMFIARGEKFVANIVVSQPDLRWSVAEVTLLGKDATIQVGDLVLSSLD